MDGGRASLRPGSGGATSDLAERFSPSHSVLALVGWPARRWPQDVVAAAQEEDGGEGELLSLMTSLPARDPAIIRLAAAQGVTTIFHVWDDFVQPWKENPVSADKMQTIVTVQDDVFQRMRGFPFSRFNGHFLGYQVRLLDNLRSCLVMVVVVVLLVLLPLLLVVMIMMLLHFFMAKLFILFRNMFPIVFTTVLL